MPKSKMIPADLIKLDADLLHEMLERHTVSPGQTIVLQVVNGFVVGIDTEKRTMTTIPLLVGPIMEGHRPGAIKKAKAKRKAATKKVASRRVVQKKPAKAAPKETAAKSLSVDLTEDRIIALLKEPATPTEVGNRLKLDRRAGSHRHRIKQLIAKMVTDGVLVEDADGRYSVK